MFKHLAARSREEGGFTLVELTAYIAVLTILIGSATYSFVAMREISMVNGGATQVKMAMERALSVARNENQGVTLTFYGSAAAGHPNSYTIERNDGTPEQPVAGASYYQSDPPYYVRLQEGGSQLKIASDVTIVYSPDGTLLNVTPGVVTVSYGGRSKAVSINQFGEVVL